MSHNQDESRIFQAGFQPINCPTTMTAAKPYRVDIRVKNDSPVDWPSPDVGVPDVMVTYHWLRPSGETYDFLGLRTRLPHTLRPGDAADLPALVRAPTEPGSYVLQWDLSIEQVDYFSTRGWPAPRSSVQVLEDALSAMQRAAGSLDPVQAASGQPSVEGEHASLEAGTSIGQRPFRIAMVGSFVSRLRRRNLPKVNALQEIKSKRPRFGSMEIPAAECSHLGGYTTNSEIGDYATYYPNMWSWMITMFDIRSVIDIGCGEGRSTEYFHRLGCDVTGIEGYELAIERSPISHKIVHHDYSKGPYAPKRRFDLAWSCEFVEHVEERYIENFFATFRRCSIVFMTFALPGQGGHHHVNEQPEEYWIEQFSSRGFRFDIDATLCARLIAQSDRYLCSPDYPSHFMNKGLVFFNDTDGRSPDQDRSHIVQAGLPWVATARLRHKRHIIWGCMRECGYHP